VLTFHRLPIAAAIAACTLPMSSCSRDVSQGHVRVDVHLMSQCQFGWELMHELMPLKRELGASLELQLHHVGMPRPDGTLAAFQGPSGMLGDKLQLCARDVGGEEPWLTFLGCQGEHPEKVPEGWQACAERADIDTNVLGACAFGSHGDALLSASYLASEVRHVEASPTIFIAGKEYDGGRSRAFLKRAVCTALEGRNEACDDAVDAPRVEAVLVSDARCHEAACDPRRIRQFLEHTFANLSLRELDFAAPEARALHARTGAKQLPLVVLSSNLTEDAWALSHVKGAVRAIADGSEGYFIEYPSGYAPLATDKSAAGSSQERVSHTSVAAQLSKPMPRKTAL
jgi:hypothetical protein